MDSTYRNKTMNGNSTSGFTLVELVITLAIGSIIAASVFAAYSVQSKTFSTQRQVARIQQDLRGSLYMIESDLLNSCRDPNMTGRYTFTDVRYYDLAGNLAGAPVFAIPPAAGNSIYFSSYPVIEFTSLRQDIDGDGVGDSPVTIRYLIYDWNGDGRPDLGRQFGLGLPPGALAGVNIDLVAEGIVAMGYAFAFNLNPNGRYEITRTPPVVGGDPLGNIIWAVDADGDNRLDTNIDITGDGQVTLADDISGDGIINSADNAAAALATPVNISDAVAVKIWLLVQSADQSPENVIDTNQYVVADRVIPPNANGFQDRFKRRVKTVTIALRNYRKS